jgi:choline dehydrogenase-like flavoprotein
MGGLETTRLLLASQDIQRNGIGNQFDLLGRFFMDHISLFDGAAVQATGDFPKELFKLDYSIQQKHLGSVLAIGLTEKYKNEHELLNACGFFIKRPAYKMDDLFFSKEMQDLVYMSDMMRHAVPPTVKVVKSLMSSICNGRKLAPVLKNWFLQKTISSCYGLQLQLECIPNPESRLTLSDLRDSLGMPRLKINWKLSQQDLESYQRFRKILFNGLAKIGIKFRPVNHELDAEGWPVSIVSSKHHIGTTRMSRDVKNGVVDGDCCVHGVHNLYVASSSVFPTSGMANPTLTIAALALRVVDRVKQRLLGIF